MVKHILAGMASNISQVENPFPLPISRGRYYQITFRLWLDKNTSRVTSELF